MLIMRGTQRDGTYQAFGEPNENNMLFLAVLSELTNTKPVVAKKAHIGTLYEAKGAGIAAKRNEFVENYATEEQLKCGTEDL